MILIKACLLLCYSAIAFASTIDPDTVGLVGLWRFDIPGVVVDATGQSADGTIFHGNWVNSPYGYAFNTVDTPLYTDTGGVFIAGNSAQRPKRISGVIRIKSEVYVSLLRLAEGIVHAPIGFAGTCAYAIWMMSDDFPAYWPPYGIYIGTPSRGLCFQICFNGSSNYGCRQISLARDGKWHTIGFCYDGQYMWVADCVDQTITYIQDDIAAQGVTHNTDLYQGNTSDGLILAGYQEAEQRCALLDPVDEIALFNENADLTQPGMFPSVLMAIHSRYENLQTYHSYFRGVQIRNCSFQ
jgi:hypothetical protein